MGPALCLALLLAALAPHPNSVSSSRLVVDGAHVELRVRCQALTLLEAFPDADANADGELAQRDLDRSLDLLEGYVREHYSLGIDWSAASRDGTPLALHLTGAQLSSGAVRDGSAHETLVDLSIHFDCPRAPSNLVVDTRLFRESDPLHRDHAEIVWNGAAPVARLMWVEEPRWPFAPSTNAASGAGDGERSVLASYVGLGVEHILTGYDHIAFVVALVIAARRTRALIGVVSAFTLAHSLTLAGAAFGAFDLPARIVEPAIALSIVWVGARNLLARPPARLWPEAFGFGLIHGLGFAGSIAETLAAERSKLAALLGFNLGVEVGQLAIVAALVAGLALAGRTRSARGEERAARPPERDERATLAPVALRRLVALVVCALGAWWFVARVGA